jgi:predicted NACHT family NTPase
MAKRSLRASPAGVKKAKHQFALKGWTQEYLANEVGIKTRQPIWRFFAGLSIERYTFFELCTRLDLNWREIAINPPLENDDHTADETELDSQNALPDLDVMVREVRSQRRDKIENQCGILQLLDISRPVPIQHIYTDVNILEKIASQQWLEPNAIASLNPEDIERFGLGKISDSQIPGMSAVEKYSKLRVLGKPGSGKSTFLKYLAVQCNNGKFAADQVPIFITLRDFAESCRDTEQVSLLKFIDQEFQYSDINDLAIIKQLLQAGRILLIIDGMDEVWHEQEHTILNEIRRFSEKYHKNQFVASCRTASQKLSIKGFTDVEIAPFTEPQIASFARKWFVEFSKTSEVDGLASSSDFMAKLELAENWRFRRLVSTPLFLHLACSIFLNQGKFPIKQAEFYKQGMDLLLGKWDEARGIERDQIYRGFLLPQKLKLLSQIALATFEQGQYVFEQGVIEQHISDYMQSLPEASIDPEEIQEVSESVLRAIESQHGLLTERARGIFSFSYLALQEYFTARKIVASHNLQALQQSLQGLVEHITDPHWREIFLLTTSMLRSADGLVQLMKQQIDAIVTKDPYLQEYLTWASQKSQDNAPEVKSATGRAFYLALTQAPHLAPHFALACTLDQGIFMDATLDDLLNQCLLTDNQDFAHIHACGNALSNVLGTVLDLGFHKSLQELSDQLPNGNNSKASFEKWCRKNYAVWVAKLQQVIVNHRDISYHWEFSPPQQKVLQSYYDANRLLLDCLNSNCEVTASIREEIESTLLLPQEELEQREWTQT